ncbi:2-dehydropantoate 2-reductase [Methylobacterium brachythecii]|uniref:2-dehydropantoate 2-reductase n=2 Tax=Methylobacterium brachythecii TaxID=1176177 RepID=A0A7W6AFM5_9HYPH|nr:2-dehydropantoate 2-reductase [Methylobacterium brachythecii]MBB3900669.1 2-dehydropantoate 2-reductase [Methylobacterium brachythecii]GLS43546.1 2-dehydropantoate 2-reductase [Methylobacterium brachythecii]
MKVTVMGAGAVGCYYGGLLARAGHAVTLIGRQPHVDAVRKRGLLLEIGASCEAVPVTATTNSNGVADAELVLVCVKSGDTETVGRDLVAHLSPGTTVLSLQNGIDNAERLQAVIERHVVPVAVYVATEMAGPGHVRHHGRGDLIMGECPTSGIIAAVFEAAGIPTTISARAIDALWGKLILNCAYNALSAMTQLPYGRLIGIPGIDVVMTDVVEECMAVAAASGVVIPPDCLTGILALADTMPDQFSSTAQDLARGRPSEIDHLNGTIVRRGQALNVPTPVNRVLYTLIKALDSKQQAA